MPATASAPPARCHRGGSGGQERRGSLVGAGRVRRAERRGARRPTHVGYHLVALAPAGASWWLPPSTRRRARPTRLAMSWRPGLGRWPAGTIVAGAVRDHASGHLTAPAVEALRAPGRRRRSPRAGPRGRRVRGREGARPRAPPPGGFRSVIGVGRCSGGRPGRRTWSRGRCTSPPFARRRAPRALTRARRRCLARRDRQAIEQDAHVGEEADRELDDGRPGEGEVERDVPVVARPTSAASTVRAASTRPVGSVTDSRTSGPRAGPVTRAAAGPGGRARRGTVGRGR